MANSIQQERFDEIENLAYAAGLRPYDVHFFEVPQEVIYQVASYGLPTRYRHWSFGKVYQHQRVQHEMGFSKIYELILNNDPSYAFLDKNNTSTTNLLIAAHCFAHSDFFANNIMFVECGEENMIQVAKRHAEIIDEYRKDYGDDEVDNWLDIALSLARHVDVYKGLKRKRYANRHIEYKERTQKPYEDLIPGDKKPLVQKTVKGIHIPPAPEKDLLWFLAEYANLEPWQQRIFEIVRRESYYFYPQYCTKIMNEGWASYWHVELMGQYALGNENDFGVKGIKHPLTSEEHLDFVASHEKIVQPGPKIPLKVEIPERNPITKKTTKHKIWNPIFEEYPGSFAKATRINPYYVGFRIFRDIKKRWDEYYKQGYMKDEWGEKIPVTINGNQKIREVMREENDVSFFRKYLTEDLSHELHLFAFGSTDKYVDNYGMQEEIEHRNTEDDMKVTTVDEQIIDNKTVIVQSKDVDKIIRFMSASHGNYGVPLIVVRRVDEAGLLRLEHLPSDKVNLDIQYAEHVIKYVYAVWGRPIEMIRRENDKTWLMRYNGFNFEIDYETTDYPESIESSNIPSSW